MMWPFKKKEDQISELVREIGNLFKTGKSADWEFCRNTFFVTNIKYIGGETEFTLRFIGLSGSASIHLAYPQISLNRHEQKYLFACIADYHERIEKEESEELLTKLKSGGTE